MSCKIYNTYPKKEKKKNTLQRAQGIRHSNACILIKENYFV